MNDLIVLSYRYFDIKCSAIWHIRVVALNWPEPLHSCNTWSQTVYKEVTCLNVSFSVMSARKELIQIWMSANKKAVFWQLKYVLSFMGWHDEEKSDYETSHFFTNQVQSSFIFACNAVLAAIHSFRYPIIKLFFGVQEGGNNWQSSTREYRPVSRAMVARSVSMIFIAKRPWASFSWHFPPFEDPCHWSAVWPSTR